MTEPDYSQYTLEELHDTFARIDAKRFPARAKRLQREIRFRAEYPERHLLRDQKTANSRRSDAHTKAAVRWGAAGAISLPCSLALLNAMTGVFSRHSSDIEAFLVYGSYFGGWFAGSVTGLINESLRERREGNTLPGAIATALGALVMSMLCAGCVVPIAFFLAVIFLFLLAALFFGALGALGRG